MVSQRRELPDPIRRAIYGEMTLEEKRAAVEKSMDNWWRCGGKGQRPIHNNDGHKEHTTTVAGARGRAGLLDMLLDTHLDGVRSWLHEVTSICSAKALAMLSAASRRHHEHCQPCLHAWREMMEEELTGRLSCSNKSWQPLAELRRLRIQENLPASLRPMLGGWLQIKGRLAHVTCVCCRSWVRAGEEIGWIELDSIRAGEPERMTPDERLALEKLDTADGLLKTVLKFAGPVQVDLVVDV